MDIYEALYTTRAMRRVTDAPIAMDVQQRILDAAIRAPSGGNSQAWRFLLVDDPKVRGELGPVYRACMTRLWEDVYKDMIDRAKNAPDTPAAQNTLRMQRSAQWLADNFERYPLLLFAFSKLDPTGASIFPSVWSAMLAARAEGVGTALTSVLAFETERVLEILAVPKGEGWNLNGCVTFGYPSGRWGVAPRRPAHEVTFRNQWGGQSGFSFSAPLWPRKR